MKSPLILALSLLPIVPTLAVSIAVDPVNIDLRAGIAGAPPAASFTWTVMTAGGSFDIVGTSPSGMVGDGTGGGSQNGQIGPVTTTPADSRLRRQDMDTMVYTFTNFIQV